MIPEVYKFRFEQKYIPEPNTGCWIWTAWVSKKGYGAFRMPKGMMNAHRAAYILYRGNIPEGLEIDHLCRNRWCVNPEHLEAVSHKENLKRSPTRGWHKPVCNKGHLFNEENTYLRPKGRECRKCNASYARKWRRLH